MRQDKVIVLMPAYNEAAQIAKVIASIPKKITTGSKTFSIGVLVVDDCSVDETYEQAKGAGATVLRHVINSGAGAATRTGLRYAANQSEDLQYVVTIDADGQHDTDDIKKLLQYAITHDADMVVGNRLHAGNRKDMPLHRTFGNKGLSLISRVLFGVKTEDTQSGLRLIKRSALTTVADYSIDRYGFCTEMLWQAVRGNLRVDEVPITVTYSKETLAKGQSNWGVIDLVLDLLWIRLSK